MSYSWQDYNLPTEHLEIPQQVSYVPDVPPSPTKLLIRSVLSNTFVTISENTLLAMMWRAARKLQLKIGKSHSIHSDFLLCFNYITMHTHLQMFFCNRVSFEYCHNIKHSLQVQHLHQPRTNLYLKLLMQQRQHSKLFLTVKACRQSNTFLIFSECPLGLCPCKNIIVNWTNLLNVHVN